MSSFFSPQRPGVSKFGQSQAQLSQSLLIIDDRRYDLDSMDTSYAALVGLSSASIDSNNAYALANSYSKASSLTPVNTTGMATFGSSGTKGWSGEGGGEDGLPSSYTSGPNEMSDLGGWLDDGMTNFAPNSNTCNNNYTNTNTSSSAMTKKKGRGKGKKTLLKASTKVSNQNNMNLQASSCMDNIPTCPATVSQGLGSVLFLPPHLSYINPSLLNSSNSTSSSSSSVSNGGQHQSYDIAGFEGNNMKTGAGIAASSNIDREYTPPSSAALSSRPIPAIAPHLDRQQLLIQEDMIFNNFAAKFCFSNSDNTQMRYDKQHRIKFTSAAEIGEEVACKLDEKTSCRKQGRTWEASWILATVVNFDPISKVYQLVDKDNEDEVFVKKNRRSSSSSASSNFNSKKINIDPDLIITTPYYNIIRLKSPDIRPPSRFWRSGDEIIAVFPDTTSFYPGVVYKDSTGASMSVTIMFDDDNDDGLDGNPISRKVNARYVIAQSSIEYGIYDYFLGTSLA